MSDNSFYERLSNGEMRLLTIDQGNDPVVITRLRIFNLARKPVIWGGLASFCAYYYYRALLPLGSYRQIETHPMQGQ